VIEVLVYRGISLIINREGRFENQGYEEPRASTSRIGKPRKLVG
jgi:hypothetical protein